MSRSFEKPIRRRLVAVAAVLLASSAPAAEPAEASPEVKARFVRAIELFDRGDLRGAALDFEWIRLVRSRPVVTFNLALVYAGLGEPARAVVLLDEVLAAPGNLPLDRVERARTVRAEQAALLGELQILVPLEGAEVEVDGAKVGRAPLPGLVRVKPGEVLVGAQAPLHAPARETVSVPKGGRAEVSLALAPLERTPAQLKVRCPTPAAELYVDGRLTARAPFLTTVPLAPGTRRLELRRAGYLTQTETLELGEGASAELDKTLAEDPAALERDAARLEVKAGPEAVEVTVDGVRRGLVTGPLRLLPGPHTLSFERGGFHPEVREVTVQALESRTLELGFEPTPALRAELEGQRARHRVLGIGGLAIGGAALAGSAAYLIYNYTATADLDRQRQELDLAVKGGAASSTHACLQTRTCEGERDRVDQELASARGLLAVGYVGGALGLGLIATGAVLLATAPNPHGYDRPKSGLLLDSLAVDVRPGGAGVSLAGRF